MTQGKSIGIDAFALNIYVDPYTDHQLSYAYESAANKDMKAFIPFDFNWWTPLKRPTLGPRLRSMPHFQPG